MEIETAPIDDTQDKAGFLAQAALKEFAAGWHSDYDPRARLG